MGYPLPSRHHLENQECLCFMTPRCLKPGCRSPCLNKGKSLIPWGLAGMRPRQPYHLQPSWSGCCAARDGTTDSCEWGEGSTRYPGPSPRDTRWSTAMRGRPGSPPAPFAGVPRCWSSASAASPPSHAAFSRRCAGSPQTPWPASRRGSGRNGTGSAARLHTA